MRHGIAAEYHEEKDRFGNVQKGVKVMSRFELEHSACLAADEHGEVSQQKIEQAQAELARQVMHTLRELSKTDSAKQKELMDSITKGTVKWSERSAGQLKISQGRRESTKEQ